VNDLDAGVDDGFLEADREWSMLSITDMFGKVDMIRVLVQELGADVNQEGSTD
jgi:hypothetical protein